MTRTRLRLLLAAALPLTAALAACAGEDLGTDPLERPRFVSGRYTLARVAGKPLPTVFYESGSERADYTAGTLQLNLDGSFTSDYTVHFSRPHNGPPRDWQIRFRGQYEVLGPSISYRVAEVTEPTGTLTRPGGVVRGVIGGDTVTIRTHTSETAVYVRQP